jgi:ribosome production factor 1
MSQSSKRKNPNWQGQEGQEDGEPSTKVEKIAKKTEITLDNLSNIKNKIRRGQEFSRLKRQKKKDKRARQDDRKAAASALGPGAPAKLVPKTIESMREFDETTVVEAATDEIDEEVEWDITSDEFEAYFGKTYEPKVMITSGDNPHSKTIAFMQELSRILPNSEPLWRKKSSVKKMVRQAIEQGFTDIVVINEDNRLPNGLLVTHLPDGPTAHFKLSNVKITKEIRKDWREITSHRPEVILNNFTTRLGHTVGRMLAALFHYDPQFNGKRVATFHNQRDYIFFRHHRYDFKSSSKVKLRELGPRFTLRLRSIQKGTFDSKLGEYDWIISGRRHDMETSRRKFFL